MLERYVVGLLALGVTTDTPLMVRNRFLSVAQLQDIFPKRNDGKQTSRLSPLIAALTTHDLNCKCVCGPGEASSGAVPLTNASNPSHERNEEFAKIRFNGPGP